MDVRADLHIHTVLSPCAEIEMLPPLIVEEALNRGIQLIAITDHNATANIAAVQQAALDTGLIVLPGMELQTREEIHTLCLFDTLEQAAAFQSEVDARMPARANDPDHFGVQLLVDSQGEIIGQEERLLLTSANLSLEDAQRLVAALGGLFIPAHIDRKAYGLIEVLGFLPPGLPVDAVEISRHIKPADFSRRFPHLSSHPLLQNGDAHRLNEILGVNHFHFSEASILEIRQALRGQSGRSLAILA